MSELHSKNIELDTDFVQALHQLNEAQASAVKLTEGPVMVIAGPGTGKTQILAARIGHILNSSDTGPHEVLCLTFTEAGTIAMRKRLLKFIGPTAHQIAIHTFHSFCNKVIQENSEYFRRADLEAVSDLEKIEILDKIVASLPKGHVLINFKSDGSSERKSLGKLFDLMKQEHLTPDKITELSNARRAEIRDSDEFKYKRKSGNFKAGDLKINDIKKIDDKLDKLEAASSLFSRYNQLLAETSRYDFADMILWVAQLFKENESVRQSYQERFQYILVDEYQDTNGSQNEILNILCDYWDSPNVFVVGDDDQSIFRFQGAQIENILSFADKYVKNLQSAVLSENYRSTQNILDLSAGLIKHNSDRLIDALNLTEQKKLRANTSLEAIPIKFCDCFNQVHEAIYVGKQILSLIEENENPEDIAVIYRNHQHVEELAKFLKTNDLPVYMRKTENALDNALVLQLLNALKWINTEIRQPFSGDEKLFDLFHMPCFELKPIEIAKFSHWTYKNARKLTPDDSYATWREILSLQNSQETSAHFPNNEVRKKLGNISEHLENWILLCQTSTVQQLLEVLIKDLKLIEFINSKGQYFDLECIRSFFDFMKEETSKSSDISLSQILTKIDLMKSNFIGLRKERLLFDEKGINLLTAHASKGLEFKHVFIISCIAKDWEKTRPKLPYSISQILNSDDKDSEIQESRRLLYVATTRAKQSLTISYYSQDLNGKEIPRSQYLDEIQSVTPELFEKTSFQADDQEILNWNEINLQSPELEQLELLDAPIIEEYLAKYVLSVTHLNNYLNCPTSFYFENILRIPAAKNKYMSYGTAVHRSLDQLFRAINEGEKADLEFVLENFNKYLTRERSSFSDEEFKKFRWMGEEHLTSFYQARIKNWTEGKENLSEVLIDNIHVDGVPIKGQLDRIEIDGKNVHVIDFKTGNPLKGRKKMKPPGLDPKNSEGKMHQNGGDYWRQLVFYAHLVNNKSDSIWNMTSGSMDFIEPDDKKMHRSETLVINNEDLDFVREQITRTYKNIHERKFTPGCGEESCRWCEFVKSRGN